MPPLQPAVNKPRGPGPPAKPSAPSAQRPSKPKAKQAPKTKPKTSEQQPAKGSNLAKQPTKTLGDGGEEDGFLSGSDDYNGIDDDSMGDWGGYGGVALSLEPPLKLVRAANKNHLKPKLRKELSRRLRRESSDLMAIPGQVHIIRVFRFGLDELRLYQAVHEARMEGRIVVVDDPADAHVVLATQRTRTGRDISIENAKNLANNLNIPLVKLDRISGKRLMEGLAPIMNMPIPPHLLLPKAPRLPILRETPGSAEQAAQVVLTLQQPAIPAGQPAAPPPQLSASAGVSLLGSQGPGVAPGSVQGTGAPHVVTIGELIPRLWGGRRDVAQTLSGGRRTEQQEKVMVLLQQGVSERHARPQQAPIQEPTTPAVRYAGVEASVMGFEGMSVQQQVQTYVSSTVQGVDVQSLASRVHQEEDTQEGWDGSIDRRAFMPPNPNARIGNKYRTIRPIKHGRKIKMKVELRQAASEDAPW